MKKILLTLLALVAVMAVSAKIVKIKMADGTMKVFTSSEKCIPSTLTTTEH